MTSNAGSPGARYWISLVAVGLIGGLLSGMFGVGGGIVMVPLLLWLTGMDQRVASATSLLAIVPASIAGSISYLSQGEADIPVALLIASGAICGALIGTSLLKRLPLSWLRWMFIALMLVAAVRMVIVTPDRGEDVQLSVGVGIGLVALGLVMGIASGLFGIGGGIIAVPSLISIFAVSDLVAKGTSLLVMIPVGLTGTIQNIRNKLVDVRAGVVVGVAATIASFPGAILAFLIPAAVSGVLFAALLVFAAIQLAIKAVKAQRAEKRA